jgi:hypothetical protein
MTHVSMYQRVRVIGTEFVGHIANRRNAMLIESTRPEGDDLFRDLGPRRMIDGAGQYAVEIHEGSRSYYVFARVDELEAA